MARSNEYRDSYAVQHDDEDAREDFLRTMQEQFPPEKTILVGNPAAQEQYRADMPFLDHPDYRSTGRATPEDTADKRILGFVPMQLAVNAESVTEYVVRSTLQDRENRGEGFSQAEMAARNDHLITYRVHPSETTPEDFNSLNTVVVTRHPELIEHLERVGLLSAPDDNGQRNFPVMEHVTDQGQVDGKNVIGYLGGDFKFFAKTITYVAYDPSSQTYGDPVTFTTEPLSLQPVFREAR